jgi:ketosteroid isomerase-like protein
VSQKNVEVVRRLMALGEQARFSERPPPHTDLVAPDAEIDLSSRVFNPATYRGYEGWARLNAELREVWAEWEVVPERFFDAGDRVVTVEIVRGRGRSSDVVIEARYASIWTLRRGRVTRIEVGIDPDEALQAVGLKD